MTRDRISLPAGWMLMILLLLPGSSPVDAQTSAAPRDIVLMLDNSGSMRKNDPDFLTNVAVRTFLERLDGDYRIAIVSFDQRVNVLMPLTPLDDASRPRFLSSLDAINYRGLLTNSPAAMERSLYELRVSGRPGAEKSIVFMTDGIVDVAPEGADAGDVEKAKWMKSTLAAEASDNGVRIFGIAFTDNADFELIQTLAKRTGGEYFRAYTAGDIDGVFAGVRNRLSATAAVAPAAPAPVIPLPTPPAAPQAPVVESTPAEASSGTTPEDSAAATLPLPDSTGSTAGESPTAELPQVTLADVDVPKVALPEVNLGGTATGSTGEAAAETTVAQGTDTGTEQPAATGGESDTASEAGADSGQPAADSAQPAAPAPAPAPAPAAMDDSRLLMVMIVGGAALVLALAALLIVVLRRKPSATQSGDDALMPKAFLNDIGGATDQKSYELGAKPMIVGRLKGPDTDAAEYILIDESTVGRRHALLEYKEHSFWVADQNSLNGTFVNNARIEAPTRLKHGDRIRFHKHEFEFLVLDMFETDRTMMSNTVFADVSSQTPDDDDDDATVVRAESPDVPSPEDPTITRP